MKTLTLILVAVLLSALIIEIFAEDLAKKPKKSPKKSPKKAGHKKAPKKPAHKKSPKKGGVLKCSAPGYTGTCIDSTQKCCPKGTKFVDGDFCPGHSNNPHVVCCGKKSKTAPKKKAPHKKKPAKKGGWTRADCERVATAWVKHKVPYSQSLNPKDWARQFVTSGSKRYRKDCSGFLTAAWNGPANNHIGGWNTCGGSGAPCASASFRIQGKKIHNVKDLQRCDALVCRNCCCGIAGHAVLFWGWAKDGSPIIIEEYTYGKPASKRSGFCHWDIKTKFNHFEKIRRIGW